MKSYPITTHNLVKRSVKRAHYDHETVHRILDAHFLCHVCYVHEGTALAIPTGFGRKGETIYLHGALKNRMLMSALDSPKVSLTVTHADGIVLARSLMHHSFNYRSAVVFGTPRLVTDDMEKMEALQIITENIIPGRWDEARLPNEKELKVTAVIAIEITEASAKIRNWGAMDDEEDYSLDVWAGVLPIKMVYGEPEPDERITGGTKIPESLKRIIRAN